MDPARWSVSCFGRTLYLPVIVASGWAALREVLACLAISSLLFAYIVPSHGYLDAMGPSLFADRWSSITLRRLQDKRLSSRVAMLAVSGVVSNVVSNEMR
ncbi:uncharacterized protein LAESUDRAFT_378090 [Laetiporus sulphureus 93-53]|uniref:Uncharacterized protein n=1 Tax=Laetiporus sulphureus 93-53 TaxID=1314785 RepID=A0A165CQ39_9APHY|nr:uncharacterized protein LAESUDRAFT_378090 [Laetiporus sulphureus 93-53]KZT03215.1 hypothetical protein LAESUDRAFT_378090 [Laetiporus sulphureus 93-53]